MHSISRTAKAAWLLGLLLAAGGAQAVSPAGHRNAGGDGRYIVLLDDQPLAAWAADQASSGNSTTQAAGSSFKQKNSTGAPRLDVAAPASLQYLQKLDQRYQEVQDEIRARYGREIPALHRYRYATNGFAADLSGVEAQWLAGQPGVKAVIPDRVFHLEDDSGPTWIGAAEIWNGAGFLPERRGEGIIVGVIDSGANWDHPSFADPGEGQPNGGTDYDFVNPYGHQLGLCSEADVKCNDKLVGVYDFVEDDPNTTVVEENNNGQDNTNHGSLVEGTAVGNPINLSVNGAAVITSGVAPNANLVSYRVCFQGDPNDSNDDGCQESAILSAIDQAIADEVDVINYSIGSFPPNSPWDSVYSAESVAYLNAFKAGIFVATSAGNSGPAASTIGNPANAPWITAVGSATSDRLFASILKATQGGDTTPPGDLYGASFAANGVSITPIVHAKDYGFPLCGTGPEELGATCDDNTGASNPFPPNTFHGEIVVCDRGTYGRVEKGKNLLLAGAGGYVLANTPEFGEDIVADQHCLPATHLGRKDGDILRAWLDSGTDQKASLSGFTIAHRDSVADRMSDFSSRGPNQPPVQDILKPELIAPGETILGPSNTANGYVFASGTSFASPHVAGGAALVLSVHPTWTPSMVASAIQSTATTELAKDINGDPAGRFETGFGRPRLADAANAGLFLNETGAHFKAANPDTGGDPRTLNLPSMTDTTCLDTCSFTRTLSALASGRSWSASTSGFPDGVVVTVSPDSFTLLTGNPVTVTVTVDLTGGNVVGQWVYGDVLFTADNLPVADLPVSVFATAGQLPSEWTISSDRDSGSQTFTLQGLTELPEATYRASSLVKPTVTTQAIQEDPTYDDPYDGGQGVFTVLVDVPQNTLLLHADTPASDAEDVDLYVGFDSNGDGQAQESEQICESSTPSDVELCELSNPTPGQWWVLVQNWEDGQKNIGPAQDITVVTAAVGGEARPNATATGPGRVPAGTAFDVRVAWDDIKAVPNDRWLGAVGIGVSQDNPLSVGVVPVWFTRTGISDSRTLALMNGQTHGFAVAQNDARDRMYIDVPKGASGLSVSASGASQAQNDNLTLELYAIDFDKAFKKAPIAYSVLSNNPAISPQPGIISSANGNNGNGPQIELSGASLTPGRYLPVVRNKGGAPASVDIRAEVSFSGNPLPLHGGLWQPSSRPTISQGLDYNTGGDYRALLWYTYNEDHTPAWYIASDLSPNGNIWTADLLRFTNNGERQQDTVVGRVQMTVLGDNDSIFSFDLFGESGSDRMMPISPLTCPEINGSKKSYTGIWYPGFEGLGGASVLVNDNAQAQVHYMYDDEGLPRWLIAANDGQQSPTDTDISMLQFSGFCAVCAQGTPTYQEVGTVTRHFSSQSAGDWTLDYLLASPLNGDVKRTDSHTVKITNRLDCQ